MYTDVYIIEDIIIRIPWDKREWYLVTTQGKITDTFSGSFAGILERVEHKLGSEYDDKAPI